MLCAFILRIFKSVYVYKISDFSIEVLIKILYANMQHAIKYNFIKKHIQIKIINNDGQLIY